MFYKKKLLLTGLYIFGFLFLISFEAFTQSRKEIKKYGIKSATETVTFNSGGKELNYVESFEVFDKEGNIIQETHFNKDGTVRKKEVRKFHKSGKLLEETKLNDKGGIISKVIFTFNDNGEKLSEQLIDNTGKITEWIKYGYNSLDERISEHELDEKGNMVRKHIFTYDKNGLKKEKKTYNASDILISIKKYSYKTVVTED